jgi:hypothetical protein
MSIGGFLGTIQLGFDVSIESILAEMDAFNVDILLLSMFSRTSFRQPQDGFCLSVSAMAGRGVELP